MKIDEISSKYGISLRTLGTLAGASPATMAYWQKTHDGMIPERFLIQVNEALRSLDELKDLTKSDYKDIVPVVLEYRQSPFWKNWNHLKYVLTTALKAEILDYNPALLEKIKSYTLKLNPGYSLNSTIKNRTNFDLVFENKKSEVVGVFILEKVVSLLDVVKELSSINEFHQKYPKSKFYIFAQKIENSIRFATDDIEYLTFIEIEMDVSISFKKL